MRLQWKKRGRKRLKETKRVYCDRHTCPSMSKNLFHLDTSSFDFVGGVGVVVVGVVFFGWVFGLLFLSCSFTSKDRDLRMLSARLTKLESTRLRAHDDVLFDRLQILLGSPLSVLSFIGWFVVSWRGSSDRNLLAETVWWICVWMQGDALASYFTPFSLSFCISLYRYCCFLLCVVNSNKQQHE